MSAEPAGPIATPPPSAPPPDAPRRAMVLFLILATAGVFVALFAVLYFRWAGAQEPSSVVVVSATPAFEGTEIVVEGVALQQPYRVTVGSRPGNSIPFYLDRGSYTLRIVRDEKTMYSADFLIQHNQMLKFELDKLEHLLPPPATATTVAPQGR